jgi:hypothetical protein
LDSAAVHPALPLAQVDEMHAVEEWPPVKLHRRLGVVSCESVKKVVHVGANITGHDELMCA